MKAPVWHQRRGVSHVSFQSDNCRGALPEVLAAVAEANGPSAVPSYGKDSLSAKAADAVRSFLGCHPRATVVPTISGIASDVLGLAPYARPTSAVVVHETSHLHLWQCGATAFYTGAMVTPVGGAHGKVDREQLAAMLAASAEAGDAAYQPAATVVSVTQPTEAGTLYSVSELRDICEIAHHYGVSVHMDGARLANAVVALGCTPAEITWQAGVDALALGTTKGGTLAAEAIVFFNGASAVEKQPVASPVDIADVARRRKRAGHELSKSRFIAAQMVAYFDPETELWRRSARHANESAARLATALGDCILPAGLSWEWQHPVETNQLFMSFPDDAAGNAAADRLGAAVGAVRWRSTSEKRLCVRMVTAFDTTDVEIEAAARALSGEGVI
eukprot:SAG31_NODE_1896_length_6964_cov_3.399854_3_plen_389_part_00